MSVRTLVSWNAHARSTRPEIPSGPTALRIFTCLKDWVTFATEIESVIVYTNILSKMVVMKLMYKALTI